jgi:mono/diheme cytochrome c family protein
MPELRGPLLCLALLFFPAADGAEQHPAHIDYMLKCQGCHTPDGGGVPGKVPSFVGALGHFLAVEGGREFLIQVPGAAQSSLSDEELAALTNWMLQRFSKEQVPVDFEPYTAPEVGRLRQKPLVHVTTIRQGLVEAIREQGISSEPL